MICTWLNPQDLRGIDLSHLVGTIVWDEVHPHGFGFIFVKISEGNDYIDPSAAKNLDAIRSRGIVAGGYHFYRTNDDPELQALNFIENSGLGSGDLAPVVDIEVLTPGSPEDWLTGLHRFIQTLEEHYGTAPIIYTSPRFWSQHGDDSFIDYPLWIAEYEIETPNVPPGFPHWVWWQYDDAVQVTGIPKPVDISIFCADDHSLHSYTIP